MVEEKCPAFDHIRRGYDILGAVVPAAEVWQAGIQNTVLLHLLFDRMQDLLFFCRDIEELYFIPFDFPQPCIGDAALPLCEVNGI